jgi:hypothetical protein
MQYLPIISTLGATGTSKSAATVTMCQTLSTPLSFWEYQASQNQKQESVVSPCFARTSQIIAEGVVVDNLDKEKNIAQVSRLAGSDIHRFTIKCSPIDTDALRDVTKVAKAGSGNVFLANDCLVALKPIQEGETLFIDAATIDAQLYLALPEVARIKLVGFTEPSLRAYLSSEAKMKVGSLCPKLDVHRTDSIGEALRCIKEIQVGETLYDFHKDSMSNLPFATMYTICLTDGIHMLVDGGCQCIAHSCDPNTKIVVDEAKGTMKTVAIKHIMPGDVVSFNYVCTEWEMDCPFQCACGSPKCVGKVAGFRFLKPEIQDELLKDIEGNGINPVVAKLAIAARTRGAKNPAIPFRATDDYSRGAIITVNISQVAEEDVAGSANSSSSSCGHVVRDDTNFFKYQELDVNDISEALSKFMEEETTSTSSSASPALPSACVVGNAIVALRDIKKGDEVTIRKFISKNGETHEAFKFYIDDFVAQKLRTHILNIVDEKNNDVETSRGGIPVHRVVASKDQATHHKLLQVAQDIRMKDALLGRSSLLFVADNVSPTAAATSTSASEKRSNLGMLLV